MDLVQNLAVFHSLHGSFRTKPISQDTHLPPSPTPPSSWQLVVGPSLRHCAALGTSCPPGKVASFAWYVCVKASKSIQKHPGASRTVPDDRMVSVLEEKNMNKNIFIWFLCLVRLVHVSTSWNLWKFPLFKRGPSFPRLANEVVQVQWHSIPGGISRFFPDFHSTTGFEISYPLSYFYIYK